MDQHASIIAGNLRQVRERVAAAAQRAGRTASEVRIVGVTKYVGADQAAALLAAGCEILGESRPQELWHKAADARLAAAPWHLVGHLQRNKIRRTLPLVNLIHSVDSERLLAVIDIEAGAIQKPADVLLEVNTSGEAAKHGLSPDELPGLLDKAEAFPHVRIRGLMTMAALEGGPAVARRNFASLRELRDRLRSQTPPCVELAELSMGMSGDFEEAVAEGATLVRIGTALWQGVDLPSAHT